MNRQMNEPMKVELGIWPIFAFLFGTSAVAATATTAAVAATTGFLTYAGITAATLLTANSLISMFNQPQSSTVSIPGVVTARGLSSTVATALQRERTQLETLQQEGLKKQEELEKIETQAALKQKTQNILSKYGPFLAAGGVALLILLVVLKKKRK